MKKNLIPVILVGVVVILGIVGFTVLNKPKDEPKTEATTAQNSNSTSESTSKVTVIDPDGEYKLFSDPSIIQKPAENLVFGNGQTITVEYDQSKGDAGSALFYKLYYVDKKGVVFQLADSRFETRDGNVYSTSNKVFNSDADGLSGFLEVFIVPDANISGGVASGTQLKLGMYPIKFETDKS